MLKKIKPNLKLSLKYISLFNFLKYIFKLVTVTSSANKAVISNNKWRSYNSCSCLPLPQQCFILPNSATPFSPSIQSCHNKHVKHIMICPCCVQQNTPEVFVFIYICTLILKWNGCLRELNAAIPETDLVIIIIIIKKGRQCKALREWYTPYQSEDPSPTIPTYRQKEEKGKESRRL